MSPLPGYSIRSVSMTWPRITAGAIGFVIVSASPLETYVFLVSD
jgi:hypothetical protein